MLLLRISIALFKRRYEAVTHLTAVFSELVSMNISMGAKLHPRVLIFLDAGFQCFTSMYTTLSAGRATRQPGDILAARCTQFSVPAQA